MYSEAHTQKEAVKSNIRKWSGKRGSGETRGIKRLGMGLNICSREKGTTGEAQRMPQCAQDQSSLAPHKCGLIVPSA